MNAQPNITKKITAATFKAFVRKNRESLQIQVAASFDGMTDGVEYTPKENRRFKPATAPHENYSSERNDCGINGVWLVGNSRDYFTAYNENGMQGIEVSNCCGRFVVAVPTGPETTPAPSNIIAFPAR